MYGGIRPRLVIPPYHHNASKHVARQKQGGHAYRVMEQAAPLSWEAPLYSRTTHDTYGREQPMHEQLLTPEQAATFLHLKPATLARWRWAGCGPRFVKVGGRVRYEMCELQAFIQAGIRSSTSDPGVPQ